MQIESKKKSRNANIHAACHLNLPLCGGLWKWLVNNEHTPNNPLICVRDRSFNIFLLNGDSAVGQLQVWHLYSLSDATIFGFCYVRSQREDFICLNLSLVLWCDWFFYLLWLLLLCWWMKFHHPGHDRIILMKMVWIYYGDGSNIFKASGYLMAIFLDDVMNWFNAMW